MKFIGVATGVTNQDFTPKKFLTSATAVSVRDHPDADPTEKTLNAEPSCVAKPPYYGPGNFVLLGRRMQNFMV